MSTAIPSLTVKYKGVTYHLNDLAFTYSPRFDVQWESIQDKDWKYLEVDRDIALSDSMEFKKEIAKAIATYR